MGIPQEAVFDAVQFQQDKQTYNHWLRHELGTTDDEDEKEYIQRISDMIYTAIRLELTEKQRIYFWEYYMEGLTEKEIAIAHGVAISTVSRTVARARLRVRRVLKYVDPRLLRLFERGDKPEVRQNGRKAKYYRRREA